MANISSYVQMPVDAGGKKIRTTVQTVGTNDCHAEYVIGLRHDYQITNMYSFHSGALVIGAAADAANVGRVYVENDPDSTVLIAVQKIRFTSQMGSVLATPTSPRIMIRRFTFSGNTPSGAAIVGSLTDTSMTAKDSNWNVRSASTGMTIAETADVVGFLPTANQTAVGHASPFTDIWEADPMFPLILRAGHGIMVKQVDAGTTSDTRRFHVDIRVAEIVPVTVT